MSEEIKAREFWLGPSITGWTGFDSRKAFEHLCPDETKFIHVIEKSYADKLQQELDAARAEIEKLNNYTIKGYEEFFGEMKKQLTDAKAQIADYEAALNVYKKWHHCDVPNIALEVINKWSGKLCSTINVAEVTRQK